jgi:hypothetical protein
MLAYCGDLALVEDDYYICILNRCDTLCYDDLCRFGDEFLEALADERIGTGVDRAGRVVKNKYFGLFEKCTGNAKTLLLTARYVGTALLDEGIVALGEGGYEIVCLSETSSLDHFLVGSLFITPSEIVLYGTREENVLLQYNGYVVTEHLKVIVTHVNTANVHLALGCVVKT